MEYLLMSKQTIDKYSNFIGFKELIFLFGVESSINTYYFNCILIEGQYNQKLIS